jgi:hypothetical protein
MVPTLPMPSPAEATGRAVAHCYLTTARADAARALDVTTGVVAVPTLETIAAIADDMTARAARA